MPASTFLWLEQFNIIPYQNNLILDYNLWIYMIQFNLKDYLIINRKITTFASCTQIACADIF